MDETLEFKLGGALGACLGPFLPHARLACLEGSLAARLAALAIEGSYRRKPFNRMATREIWHTWVTADRAPLATVFDSCDVGPHRVSPVQLTWPHLLHRGRPNRCHVNWREAMSAFNYRLSVVHRRLDDAIRRELKLRFPDRMKLLRLKKLKLAVKDRLRHGFRGRKVEA